MNRALDILGVYVLPLCCFVADYAAGYLGTELYPLTLWTFGAAGMTAFALSGRAMSSRARASVAAGAMLVAAAGAGLIAVPLFFVGLMGVVGVFALLTSGDPIACCSRWASWPSYPFSLQTVLPNERVRFCVLRPGRRPK